MAGRIYVTGGGSAEDTRLFDENFFNELTPGSKFVFVTTGYRGGKYERTAQQWMIDLLLMHKRPDLICQMVDDLAPIRSLAEYQAVYIGGGDAELLMNEMDRTGFEFILERFNRHGGILYGGGSGGGTIMGRYIDTTSEIHHQFRTGLNLIDKYSIRAHFRGDMDNGVAWRNWPAKHDSKLVCLPEDVGIVFKDGKIESFSSRRYKIYE